MPNTTTRDRIVKEADQLFYKQGFDSTSFTQIADAVGISRGNFYHHFKTKDDILEAVIGYRLDKTNMMLDTWELEGDSPVLRIRSFINILLRNQAKIKHYGCPVGTLSTELTKLSHSATSEANELFVLFRCWLCQQFKQMGRTDDADDLAMHLLALSQGVATVYNAFHDEHFLQHEVNRLHGWLDTIKT